MGSTPTANCTPAQFATQMSDVSYKGHISSKCDCCSPFWRHISDKYIVHFSSHPFDFRAGRQPLADIYATLPVNYDLIQEYNEARDEINKFLDSPTPVKIGSAAIIYRYVLEVLLWGGLAHANREKKLVYDT